MTTGDSPTDTPIPRPAGAPPHPSAIPIQPPIPPRSSSPRTVVAWLALAIVTTAMLLLNSNPKTPEAAKPGEAAHAPIDPAEHASALLKLVAKYSLGAKQTLGGLTPGAKPEHADTAPSMISQFAGRLEDQASTPIDQVRAAMVMGELGSADAGAEQAEKLAADESLDAGLREDARLVTAVYQDPARPARDILTPEDRTRLTTRHHWFAEVLLSRGQPDTEPARAAVLRSGVAALWTVIGAFGIAVAACAVGFIFFVIALILLTTRKIRPAFVPDRSTPAAPHASLLESLVLFLLLLVGLGVLAGVLDAFAGFDIHVPLLWIAILPAFWPRLWGMDRARWKQAIGWHTGRGVFREIGAGALGYITGLPIVAVGLIITAVLVFTTGAKPSHPAVEQAAAGGWLNALKLLSLACLWAPICEETFFRGAMYAHCRRWMHPVLSALLVAFVFAAIHPQGLAVVPALMSLAVSFALIREWRGSIISSATAHAIHNGFLMTLNLLILGG